MAAWLYLTVVVNELKRIFSELRLLKDGQRGGLQTPCVRTGWCAALPDPARKLWPQGIEYNHNQT